MIKIQIFELLAKIKNHSITKQGGVTNGHYIRWQVVPVYDGLREKRTGKEISATGDPRYVA